VRICDAYVSTMTSDGYLRWHDVDEKSTTAAKT
jgi:hypothetical protein